jgi:exosortase
MKPIIRTDQNPSVIVPQPREGLKTTKWLPVVLFMGSLLAGWRPLFTTLRLAAENAEYTHILLILPVSLALIAARWKSARNLPATKTNVAAFVMSISAATAVASLLLAVRIAPDIRLSLNMLALITWWIGTFVLCFGSAAARMLAFPLCFLYCMVPAPGFVLDELINLLQNSSAFCAELLFGVAGVPVVRDQLLLSIPGLTIEVAKECSSIRSSLMLLVTTMVLAQLYLRSPIRKAVVIAIAVPLSVAKNGLRIFVLAMLGTLVNPGFLYGRLHHQGGIVFFLVSLLLIFLVLWVLERVEKNRAGNAPLRATASS